MITEEQVKDILRNEQLTWDAKCKKIVETSKEQAIAKACTEFKFFLDILVQKDADAFRTEVLREDVKVWYEDFKHCMGE